MLPDKKDFYVLLLHKIVEYLDSDLNGSVDWPYTHMYSYCLDRGLPFADKVNWGDGALRPLSPLDRVGLSTIHSYADEINRSKTIRPKAARALKFLQGGTGGQEES